MLSGRGLCDELIIRPEESYQPWCVVMCDLETSRIDAPYIYDISSLRVNDVRKHEPETQRYSVSAKGREKAGSFCGWLISLFKG